MEAWLAGANAAVGLWLTLLFLFMTLRLYQLRYDLLSILDTERHYRRDLSGLVGVWMLSLFSVISRTMAAWDWASAALGERTLEPSLAYYLPIAAVASLLCLWMLTARLFGMEEGGLIFRNIVVGGVMIMTMVGYLLS